MKTRGQKIGELIDALDNGYILFHKINDGIYPELEFLFINAHGYNIRGWGSAYGTPIDRIKDLIKNPDNWSIFPKFNLKIDKYPYPWSSKFDKNKLLNL